MQTPSKLLLEGLARRLSAPAAIYVSGTGTPSSFGMVLNAAANTQYAFPYNNVHLTLDTPFRIASNTKPFTAAAVLRLAEEGQLALDDAAETNLSSETCAVLQSGGFRPDEITLRHLLAHMSGLADHTDNPSHLADAFENPDRLWSRLEQVSAGVALGGPLCAPGEAYHYSDSRYCLGRSSERSSRNRRSRPRTARPYGSAFSVSRRRSPRRGARSSVHLFWRCA